VVVVVRAGGVHAKLAPERRAVDEPSGIESHAVAAWLRQSDVGFDDFRAAGIFAAAQRGQVTPSLTVADATVLALRARRPQWNTGFARMSGPESI
jgi:hypothetical protein